MNVDSKLDEVAIKQLAWKSEKMLTTCLLIADKALEETTFWPDSLVFDFLLKEEDRNCIGSSFRILSRTMPIIEKTGQWRRSKKEDRNGGIIFEYRLINAPMAKAFLKRYNLDKHLKLSHPQLSLGL